MRRRPVALALALALATTLSGCSGSPPLPTATPTAGASDLPPGVSVELRQQRDDVQFRQAQLVVRNDGDDELGVAGVALADPRFTGPLARHTLRTSRIPPDSVVMIRLDLPPVDCAAPDDAIPRLALDYTVDGAPARAEVDVADPLGFLPALHARECLAERLAAVAGVSVAAFEPSDAPAPATLVLQVAARGTDRTAGLRGIQDTPLLAFSEDGAAYAGAPLDVPVPAGSTQTTTVRIPVRPNRCDPHVVQEDKRGTLFTLDVELDGEPGAIELASPPALKSRMLAWVVSWCGMPGTP